MEIIQIIALAFAVEAVWENLKMVWDEGKFSIDKIGSLVIGMIVAYAYNMDLFSNLGITGAHNIVGIFLTGVLISRGGNYIHDFINRINGEGY